MSVLRFSTIVLTCLTLDLWLNVPAFAQQKAAVGATDTKSKGEDLILSAAGWPIHITYFESPAGKESPVVILLTSTEGSDKTDARNRQIWQPTALSLQKSGFAVVTADLRKHGDSILTTPDGKDATAPKMNAEDYALMAAVDLEAIKAFLMTQHSAEKLNIRKLGIVSMGSSSMVAAAFSVADWSKTRYPDAPTLAQRTPRGEDVRALIAYSPTTSVKAINSTSILKSVRALPIAVHVVASKDNKDDYRHAEKFFKAVDTKDDALKEFRKLTPVPGEVRSERFLEGKFADVTTKDITDFLTKNLKDIELPWVSRKSRLTD